MRKPSSRITRDTIDIYYAGGIKYAGIANGPNLVGPDGGYAPSFNTTPNVSDFQCSVQYQKASEATDELSRTTELRTYSIICGTDPEVGPRDLIIYVDNTGVLHNLYVEASNDQAGRGSCWRVTATERR